MAKVALITGAARRIGAEIAKNLHAAGLKVIVHYYRSEQAALALVASLNDIRAGSAVGVCFDLTNIAEMAQFSENVIALFGRLDVLVNNASTFYPVETVSEQQWDDLVTVNLKAPYFLIQQFSAVLSEHSGSVINITDANASKPRLYYEAYCIAKEGLLALTRQMASRLAPAVRVNAVAPSLTLAPEGAAAVSPAVYQRKVDALPLGQKALPADIAEAVRFLVLGVERVTGQVLGF